MHGNTKFNAKEARFERKSAEDINNVKKQLDKLKKWKNPGWYIYKQSQIRDALCELVLEILAISDYFGVDIHLKPRLSTAELSRVKVQELVGTMELIMALSYMDPYSGPGTKSEQIFNLAKNSIDKDTDSLHPLLEVVTRVRAEYEKPRILRKDV